VDLAFFEWGREFRGREAPILLAHATGFHARAWDQVVRHLGERHVISVDQRGHGRSEKTEITHWNVFGQDLAALVGDLDLRDIVGVGHSMGGHAMTEAAAACPDRFRRLVLIDPVIASPGDYAEGGWRIQGLGDVHPTAKRKRHFGSPEEMFARFEDRVPYSLFDPEALRDYCTYGLLPAEGGGFELACLPETEASVYMTSRTNPGVYDSIRALEIPVLILRAKEPPPERTVMDFSSSPTWPGLVHEFRKGREIYFPDHTHFLPMEIPERIAGLILAEAGGGSG
jgi:pimeloyl-ACP methyl ester carboxylesterase